MNKNLLNFYELLSETAILAYGYNTPVLPLFLPILQYESTRTSTDQIEVNHSLCNLHSPETDV